MTIKIVPANEIVPGLKETLRTGEIERDSRGEPLLMQHSREGRFLANNLPASSDVLHALCDRQGRNALLEYLSPFNGQVVVDLGAGSTINGYLIAKEAGARGYIAVERHFAKDLLKVFREPDYRELSIFEHFNGGNRAIRDLPVSIVEADMLDFLKNLPDRSVSLLTCGINTDVLFTPEYNDNVRKEVYRVLHPEGALFSYDGLGGIEGVESTRFRGPSLCMPTRRVTLKRN